MASEGDHGRILATAARQALTPLGFWRKGRSRIWLADRSFWLAVVEFQPSSYSKGIYLNVSAHWLWSAMPDILSFDYMVERSKPWIDFKDIDQFGPLAERLAHQAADESRELQEIFTDLGSTAATLVAKHSVLADAGRGGGWPAFNAAISTGVAGDMATASRLLNSAYDSIGAWRPDLQRLLVPFIDAAKSPVSFNQFVAGTINTQRAQYGLGAVSGLIEAATL